MDGVGDEFFSGAGFASDEDGGIGGCDLVDGLVDFAHGVGVADDVFGSEAVFELGA